MGRIHRCCYALLMLLLTTRSASALQLQWTGGATTLSFTEATRCTMVVQADSSEQRLPAEWRLLWVADSCDISPVPLDEQLACLEPFAQVSAVDEPSTTADSAAHLRTIHFCSDENDPVASAARYVLDLPMGSAGRFQAVALDPNDSTQVIESNEITFNGGVSGEYAPVILSATSVHDSRGLSVTLIGDQLSTQAGTSVPSAGSIAAVSPRWTRLPGQRPHGTPARTGPSGRCSSATRRSSLPAGSDTSAGNTVLTLPPWTSPLGR